MDTFDVKRHNEEYLYLLERLRINPRDDRLLAALNENQEAFKAYVGAIPSKEKDTPIPANSRYYAVLQRHDDYYMFVGPLHETLSKARLFYEKQIKSWDEEVAKDPGAKWLDSTCKPIIAIVDVNSLE